MTFRIDWIGVFQTTTTSYRQFELKGFEGRGEYCTLVTDPNGRGLYYLQKEIVKVMDSVSILEHPIKGAEDFSAPWDLPESEVKKRFVDALLRLEWGPQVR